MEEPATQYLPTAEEAEVLLGRELSPNEVANFGLFLTVATARLNALLGCDILEWERTDDGAIIKLLLARLVGVISNEQELAHDCGVQAKAVEDFKVEYDREASQPMTQFVQQSQDLLKIFAPKATLRAGRTDYDGKILCI